MCTGASCGCEATARPVLASGRRHVQIDRSDMSNTLRETRLLRRSAFPIVALLLAACGGDTVEPGPAGPPNIDLAQPWTTASVSEVGGSPAMVEAGVERARANDRLRSLLVVKDGRLVVEEYFNGSQGDLHDVRSVTKSVVSALTGLVVERGDIGSPDDAIGDYLDGLVSDLEPRKAAITIEHLLTMASGLEWDESGGFGDYTRWLRSDDHLGYILGKPLVADPGTQYNYNSGAVHLLGVVLERATGTRLPELADRLLLGRIGVSRSRWEPLRDGFHNGGAGLDLRPRDLARFGQLYLQNGESGGSRILPEGWVGRSATAGYSWRSDLGALDGISYGLLWWVVPGAPEPLYFAWGFGGQYVVVVPGMNLVIVTTSDWPGMGAEARGYEQRTMDLLVDMIIPAFR